MTKAEREEAGWLEGPGLTAASASGWDNRARPLLPLLQESSNDPIRRQKEHWSRSQETWAVACPSQSLAV